MNTQIVIVGAGFAGMLAALRLSRTLSANEATITLVNASDMFVERTRLHQLAAGQRPKMRSIRAMLRGTRVEFVQATVEAIEPERRQVVVTTAAGPAAIGYDVLLYALGSRADRARIPGLEQAYVLDAADAPRLAERLPGIAARQGRALVIGGGLTGIEAATELAESFPGLKVVIALRGRLGDDLSPAGAAHVRATLARLGVEVLDRAPIARLEADAAVAESGDRIPFDACVNCIGLSVPALAREAGLRVNRAGQIEIDAFMRSISHPGVFAAGDAAAFAEEARMPLRMACATALPMAAHAAETIAALVRGQAPRPFEFGYSLRCISLGRRDALVQFVDARDVPRPRVITGRPAAWVKEGILRFVTASLDLEKRVAFYRGSRAIRALAPGSAEPGGISLAPKT